MKANVAIFSIATLLPLPLLVLGGVQGGVWIWGALVYLTVFTFALDEMIVTGANPANPADPESEFPAANALSALLALAHFPLLALAVWAVSGGSGLSGFERLGAFFAFGLFFGQVSNSNAHELIHRGQRPLFELGKWVFISHLFGHHTSAHRLVHHQHVATPQDPNSARQGESFYHFAPRAWVGSFKSGFLAENTRRRGEHSGLHPYTTYLLGGVFILAISALVGGVGGIFTYVALVTYVTMQLLMSDYVQHYGLSRGIDAEGRIEPVGPQHSWNSPHWFSSLLMLNAPRHSDHHAHPARPYPALGLPQKSPTLPRSLPVMGFIALHPRRWRKLMDPRVAALSGKTGK